MKLWLLTQTKNRGYDTYSSCVVAAESEDEARSTLPGELLSFGLDPRRAVEFISNYWASPEFVSVTYLGEAKDGIEPGSICSSFNAG